MMNLKGNEVHVFGTSSPIWHLYGCYSECKQLSQEQMTSSTEIIAELERRVDQRRQEGKYPVGLEQQLEAEFKAIIDVVHRGSDSVGELEVLLKATQAKVDVLNGLISPKSRIPLGSIYHRIIGRLVGHHTRGVAIQTREVMELQMQVLEVVRRHMQQQRDNDARVLNQLGHAMRDRLMMVDALAEAVLELERKVSSGQQNP
jgi:hypothetical protein